MAVTARVLISQANVPDAQGTAYTSPGNGKGTWIDKLTATNYSGSTATVSVNLVPSGGVAGNTNLIVKTKSLAPGETYTFPEIVGKFLNPGDFISWIASAATSVNGGANGREIT